MKLLQTIKGFKLMFSNTGIFHPEHHFKDKKVAVIGAADSAFEKEMGTFIDNFDYIIRINKAPHALSKEKFKHVGSRTDVLYHSFFENTDRGGGGPINWQLYEKQGVQFLVNPNNNISGLKAHLNYYKRNLSDKKTHLLPMSFAKKLRKDFGEWVPTVGYSGLYTVLNSGCKEVYITGFTFFKTPYADDYRDDLQDVKKNDQFIKNQGFHNPDLELKEFMKQLSDHENSETNIIMDDALSSIVNGYKKHLNEK